MNKLKIGDKAPLFTLKDKDGVEHKLSDIKADYTIVYFYPKDNTPGCAVEAKEFTSNLAELKKVGAEVVGISGGDEKTKKKFCEKQKLKVLLLSDSDLDVAKSYGAYGKKKFMGMEFTGILRNTFVLDSKKQVVHIFESVKPAVHVQEVLSLLNQLKQ